VIPPQGPALLVWLSSEGFKIAMCL
jgi:hypothetical protein